MKKRGRSKISKPSQWDRIGQVFRHQIIRVLGAVVIVVVLLIGILPSKGLINSGNATVDTPEVKKEVTGIVTAKPEQSVYQEIKSVEAPQEMVGVHVPILMYHYIDTNPHSGLSVNPINFEAQLQYLQTNGWTTITLDDLILSFKNPTSLPSKPIVLTFDDGYSDFYSLAWPILQKYNMKSTIYIIARQKACNSPVDYGQYMTPEQIKELSRSPLITIAAHTLDHCDLRGMSEADQRQEIFGSKAELEALTGKPVMHFAYPYGDFNDTTVKLVREAGYTSSASTIQGSINNESTILTMRRLRIGNSLPIFTELINK